MTNKYHVWGFENSRANVNAEFNAFNDAMVFAMALKSAIGINYIQIENYSENVSRSWKLTNQGWNYLGEEKIEE